jgi:hypothetical protein
MATMGVSQGTTVDALAPLQDLTMSMSPPPPYGRTLANVLWLVEPPGWRDALVVGTYEGPLRDAMSVRFANVEVVTLADAVEPRLPFPSGRFDLLAIDAREAERTGSLARPDGTHSWPELLRRTRLVLRDEGVLLIAGANPRWFRRFLPARRLQRGTTNPGDINAMSAKAVVALLLDCGWTRPVVLFADPSSDDPRYLFPASRRAARANEHLSRRRSLASSLRLWAVAMGMQELLYPARLFVATR